MVVMLRSCWGLEGRFDKVVFGGEITIDADRVIENSLQRYASTSYLENWRGASKQDKRMEGYRYTDWKGLTIFVETRPKTLLFISL